MEGQGGPLSIVVAGANAHDATLLDETLEAIVVERPQLTDPAARGRVGCDAWPGQPY